MDHFWHLVFLLIASCPHTPTSAIRFGISNNYPNQSVLVPATAAAITTTAAVATTTLSSEEEPPEENTNDGYDYAEVPEPETTPPADATPTPTTTTTKRVTGTAAPTRPTTKKTKTKTIIVRRTTTTTTSAPTTTLFPTNTDHINNNNRTAPDSGTQSNMFCFCDLLPSKCDVNCCCDIDCAAAALKVFDCYAQPQYAELHDRLEDFEYQHGLPSCKINDGWLCVFRTNTKTVEQPEKAHAVIATEQLYKWPHALPELGDVDIKAVSSREDSLEFYRYDAKILLLNLTTLETQFLGFPVAIGGTTPFCHIHQPVRHLRPHQHSNCLFASLSQLQAHTAAILQMAVDCKLLRQPNAYREENEGLLQQLGGFQVRNCSADASRGADHNRACRALPEAALNATLAGLLANRSQPIYWTAKITLQLLHNYTHILGGIVDLHQGRHAEQEQQHAWWQTYEVLFLHTEYATEATDIEREAEELPASGPLGYLLGEPLIVGQYVTNQPNGVDSVEDHSNEPAKILDYFQKNATRSRQRHTLQLPTKRRGVCEFTREEEAKSPPALINYGVNTYRSCTLRLHDKNSTPIKKEPSSNGRNFTATCLRLQAQAWSLLYGTPPPLAVQQRQRRLDETPTPTPTPTTPTQVDIQATWYVSRLGRPQNDSQQWLAMRMRNTDFPLAMAEYHEGQSTFMCRNILLSLTYEFQIEATTVRGIPLQARLLDASVRLGPRHDIEFGLDEPLDVPLSISVMFYNTVELASSTGAGRLKTPHGVVVVLVAFIALLPSLY